MTTDNDNLLEQHFAALRGQTPDPSAELVTRILADAEQVQAGFVAPTPARPFWQELFHNIGGWPAATGLVTASMAGLWLGISPPEILTDMTTPIFGDTTLLDFDLGDDPFETGDPS